MKLTRYALLAVIVLFTSQVHTVVTADDLEQVKQQTYKYKESVRRLMEKRAELSNTYPDVFKDCFTRPEENIIIRLLPLTENPNYNYGSRTETERELLVKKLKELNKSYENTLQSDDHFIDEENKLFYSLYVLEPKSPSCKNCHEHEIKYRGDGEPVAFGVVCVAIPYE